VAAGRERVPEDGVHAAEADVASGEEEPLLLGRLRLAGEFAGELLVELPGPSDQGGDAVPRKASGPNVLQIEALEVSTVGTKRLVEPAFRLGALECNDRGVDPLAPHAETQGDRGDEHDDGD